MAIVRWRPLRDIVSIQDEMNQLFDDFFGGRVPRRWLKAEEGLWTPNVDVNETKDEIVVTAEMPGLKKEDIKLSVQDNVLTLSGEKNHEKEEKDANFYRLERNFGSFCRSFTLPTSVEADKIKASFKDGILKVTLPKSEKVKPKEIPINIS
ncbi:MAG: Hsp20/alpha crystallin family protein [candidate division Zixibacteria bacterium]|nr:Hsp20/alpha crystallin family protein [candidate division Zixibacteria bacterium]